MIISGQKYEVFLGVSSFHAKVGDYAIDFVRDKQRIVIKRNSNIILEINDLCVKAISGIAIRNEGLVFRITSDFELTYEYMKYLRFKAEDGSWLVAEF